MVKKPAATDGTKKTASSKAAEAKGVKYVKPATRQVNKRKAVKKTILPKPEKPFLRRLFYAFMVLGVWTAMALIIIFAFLARSLPSLDDPAPPGASEPAIIVKANNGATVARTGPVYGDWLRVKDLPDSMMRALLSVEDKNFYTHPGFDGMGLMRAVVVNLRAGRVRAGGSTITQQLAKNMFLTSQRSLTRKAQELLLTFWIEQKFTKDQILSLYLNRVYFGGGAYGVDAASHKYFGHSARTLSVPEAAMLAGLVKSPSSLAPHINPDGAWKRAKLVMSTMVRTGAISQQTYNELLVTPPDIIRDTLGVDVRYFTDWIATEARRLADIKGRSILIHTTLDPISQRAATKALHKGLSDEGVKFNAGQGAIVSLDHDGAVRAMVGGSSYFKTQYNRATQALRQPGSTFKLISYIAALEHGASINDTEIDEPINIDGYAPKNYNGKNTGAMTLREAFARSINTVAVKVAEKAGRENVAEVARRLGITTNVMPITSLPLGTEEVRMIDLAGVYAAVANGGFRVNPYSIVEIAALDGEVLYRHHATPPKQVLDPSVTKDMVNMLTAVVEWGTGRRAQLDRPAAGKSGTTQDSRDAVFAGFTSEMTTVVWVGNDDFAPMKKVTGGGLPARIWKEYMMAAHAGMPVRPLLADAGLYLESAGDDVIISDKALKKTKEKKKKGFFQRLFGKKDKKKEQKR